MSNVRQAVESGDIEYIRNLLKSGTSVNKVFDGNKTILSMALENNKFEIIDFLLEVPQIDVN